MNKIKTLLKQRDNKQQVQLEKVKSILKNLILSRFRHTKQTESETEGKTGILGVIEEENAGDAAVLEEEILRLRNRYPNIKQIDVYRFRKDQTVCRIDNQPELPDADNGCDSDCFEETTKKSP
jgi:hypothetical protein